MSAIPISNLAGPHRDPNPTRPHAPAGDALVALGRWLREQRYAFEPPTPETHRRNLARAPDATARSLRDAFGWSRAFETALLPCRLFEALRDAALVVRDGEHRWRATFRFATLGEDVFAHSAYPTLAADSVFFGPDTYRFARLIAQSLSTWSPEPDSTPVIVDIGCGSGAGGIAAWRVFGQRAHVVLGDINDQALAFAAANARLAGLDDVACAHSDVFAGIDGDADLVVSNPPYMFDAAARTYRHGGALHGCELSVRIARESLARLRPGGCLVLYTGAAIVDGRDQFHDAIVPWLAATGMVYRYEEIDPDVFGEELESPHYADVERIAAVGLVVHCSPTGTSP